MADFSYFGQKGLFAVHEQRLRHTKQTKKYVQKFVGLVYTVDIPKK